MSCSSKAEAAMVAVTAVMEVTEAMAAADIRAEEVDTPLEEAEATTETGVFLQIHLC